jgi:hypothetical protein
MGSGGPAGSCPLTKRERKDEAQAALPIRGCHTRAPDRGVIRRTPREPGPPDRPRVTTVAGAFRLSTAAAPVRRGGEGAVFPRSAPFRQLGDVCATIAVTEPARAAPIPNPGLVPARRAEARRHLLPGCQRGHGPGLGVRFANGHPGLVRPPHRSAAWSGRRQGPIRRKSNDAGANRSDVLGREGV